MQIQAIDFPCDELFPVLYSLSEYISMFLNLQDGLI